MRASQFNSGARYHSYLGLAHKTVYDLLGYCHIMAVYLLVTYLPVVAPFTVNPAFSPFQRCLFVLTR